MTEIRTLIADITTMKVDAIVNAANTSLMGGGGVDGAIHRAAGPQLLEECMRIAGGRSVGCAYGAAVITFGFRLPASYVIHTVGPIWKGGTEGEAEILKSCYVNCLRLAQEKDLRSIAFPAISTGVYRFPKDLAAEIAVKTLRAGAAQTSLEDIALVAFDDETLNYYRRQLLS